MLVTLGILVVIAGLIFPSMTKLRSQGDQVKCSSNLRQLGTAISQYAQDNNNSIVPWRMNNSATSYWYASLTPYLGAGYDYTDKKWPGDSRSVFMCPVRKANGRGDFQDTVSLNAIPVRMRYDINLHIAENGLDTGASNPNGATFRRVKMSQLAAPSKTMILLDHFGVGRAGSWVAGSDELTFPHNDRLSALYMDGHVDMVDRDRMTNLGRYPYHIFWRGYDWGMGGYRED